MIPIYLIDKKVSSQTIGLWTGIIGQSLSILGSIFGGFILKKTKKTTEKWLKIAATIRIAPIFLISCLLISFESSNNTNLSDSYSLSFILYLLLIQLFCSGMLTTITFTMMMELSFLAPKNIQATHFSLLATCEVFGKLLLQPIVSAFTDHFGYSNAFILFTALYLICLISFRFNPKLKVK